MSLVSTAANVSHVLPLLGGQGNQSEKGDSQGVSS